LNILFTSARYANKDVLNDKILEFRMSDLLKWSYQIANGMEHLASLNVMSIRRLQFNPLSILRHLPTVAFVVNLD